MNTAVRSLVLLMVCVAAVHAASGQQFVLNPEFDGCAVGERGDTADDWDYGISSIPAGAFATLNLPAGDVCVTALNTTESGVQPAEQTIGGLDTSKTYTFNATVGCHAAGRVFGTCNFQFYIDGSPAVSNDPGDTFNSGSPFFYRVIERTGVQIFSETIKVGIYDFDSDPASAYGIITRFTVTEEGGSGDGDPHFAGFTGQHFDFLGETETVYNVLSDSSFQVNTLLGIQRNGVHTFLGGPVMMQLAFFTRSHTILIHSGGSFKGEDGTVTVDGTLLPFGESAVLDGGLSVSFAAFDAQGKDLGFQGDDHIVATALVTLQDKYSFRVFFIENVGNPLRPDLHVESKFHRRFLDFNASLLDHDLAPHGILGQTAHMKEGVTASTWRMEGTDKDYEVKDGLFGSQFKFNKFQ